MKSLIKLFLIRHIVYERIIIIFNYTVNIYCLVSDNTIIFCYKIFIIIIIIFILRLLRSDISLTVHNFPKLFIFISTFFLL